MIGKTIKLRTRFSTAGFLNITAKLTHQMETGNRINKYSGERIPAHYITEVVIKHEDNKVAVAKLGPGTSKHPILKYKIKGAKVGDEVSLKWVDNLGNSDSYSMKVEKYKG